MTIWKIIDQDDLGTHISKLSCELTLPGTGFKSVIRSISQPRLDIHQTVPFEADNYSPMTWLISAGIFSSFALIFVARCPVFIRVERDNPVNKCRQ